MTSEKKDEIDADDSNGRVRKNPQSRYPRIKGIRPITFSPSVRVADTGRRQNYGTQFNLFARENRCPSHAQSDRKNHRQANISYTNSMKSTLCSLFLKITSLLVSLTFYFGSSTVAQAGGNDPFSPGPVRPGNLNYRTQLPPGYLRSIR